MTAEPSPPTGPEAPHESPGRSGGLTTLGRGHVAPVFTVLLTAGLAEVVLLLLVPFGLHRFSESPWAETPRLAFLGIAVGAGLLFGTLAAIVADRRNHSPWWGLSGHLGTLSAPLLALAGLPERNWALATILVLVLCAFGALVSFAVFGAAPRSRPPRPGRALRVLGRAFHRAGNIYLGITLLIVLLVTLAIGTHIESRYTHRAAQYLVYTSPWFGVLYVFFATSLISATLRKFPWRVDQTGWLTVHTALVLLIIGSFMTFWGKKEGTLTLTEPPPGPGAGRQAALWKSSFPLDGGSRLHVDEWVRGPGGGFDWRPVWREKVRFDQNPAETEPAETCEVTGEGGKELFGLSVDRYYADATREVIHTNEGRKQAFAVEIAIAAPGSRRVVTEVLSERSGEQSLAGMLALQVRRAPDADALEALLSGRDSDGHGRVVVRDAAGEAVLTVPVPEGTRSGEAAAASIPFEEEIPGTGVLLKGALRYDRYLSGNTRVPMDASPGTPQNPAVLVMLTGPEGRDPRMAFPWTPDIFADRHRQGPYAEYTVEYDYFPLPERSLWFVADPEGVLHWVFRPSSGEVTGGLLREGMSLPLGIPMELSVSRVFDHHDSWLKFHFGGYESRQQVCRLRVDGDVEAEPGERWLVKGDETAGEIVRAQGRVFRVTWVPIREKLGFALKLHDFHRDFYPGSTEARTYESYAAIRDGDRFREPADILIDMNHPLRYKGWRLYQSRFDPESGRTTFLQVNKDPGLNTIIYPACGLLTLGLVVVFFQKRRFLFPLAAWLRRHDVAPGGQVLASFGAVALAFASTLPGVLVFVLLGEGPEMLVGPVVVILGLVGETLIVNGPVARALKGRRAPSRQQPVPASVTTGAAS